MSVPSTGVGAGVGAPRGSLSCQRAPHVPQARRKYVKGVRHFDHVMGARARRKLPPEAPISPETFPQGSSGMEVDFRASSDYHAVSAFGGSVLLGGPLRWGFGERAGCRIFPSVGYPGILIPEMHIVKQPQ
jgi:hypothetical protein